LNETYGKITEKQKEIKDAEIAHDKQDPAERKRSFVVAY
jgi:hypothetical protein